MWGFLWLQNKYMQIIKCLENTEKFKEGNRSIHNLPYRMILLTWRSRSHQDFLSIEMFHGWDLTIYTAYICVWQNSKMAPNALTLV